MTRSNWQKRYKSENKCSFDKEGVVTFGAALYRLANDPLILLNCILVVLSDFG